MPRNIVLCCDGTGNEFGASNSNVVKIYWTLQSTPSQIAYYHPGVGTMGARNALTDIGKWWTKVRGLAFGYGVSDNIADAYSFLMQEYMPGDQVYIFGFSRGAYTARALCGLLQLCGLLTPGNEAQIPYALRLFKSRGREKFQLGPRFLQTFSVECKPYFLGVWATVSSVGWILDPLSFKPWNMPYTASLPEVEIVRHAVSIDERRAFFRQNLVHENPSQTRNMKQVWFAGVHSDVGGSYPESESGLAKIALQWMLCEAQSAGLLLDQQRVIEMLGGAANYAPPDPGALKHESLQRFWWLGEIWPKRYKHQVLVSGQDSKYKSGIRLNLGRHRLIPEGAHIHQSVRDRMQMKLQNQPDYRPTNLPRQYSVEQETACEVSPRPVVAVTDTTERKPPLHRRRLIVFALEVLGALLICAAIVALFALQNTLAVPKIDRPTEIAWLQQNWTEDQRRIYYHTPQGSNLLPYAWFLALEQPRFSIAGASIQRKHIPARLRIYSRRRL